VELEDAELRLLIADHFISERIDLDGDVAETLQDKTLLESTVANGRSGRMSSTTKKKRRRYGTSNDDASWGSLMEA